LNNEFLGFTLLGVLSGVLLCLTFFALHKIREIHLATYSLRVDVASTRRETEALFAQIQALFALERKLGLPEALPPMRGWAGSPDFLLAVADEVLKNKPKCVMECSSGISTLVVACCLKKNGEGHVYSLEHDRQFADKTRSLLSRYGLAEWATVLDAPLQTNNTAMPWYDEKAIPKNLIPIEMLIVDGPTSTTAPLARFPALPRLMPHMAIHPTVIVDDADRDDEITMLQMWKQDFPHLQQINLHCEKGCILLKTKE
jgi:hypothetical protein